MKDIVLITGAAGYLGGRVSKSMSESGLYFLRTASTGRRTNPPGGLKNSESKVLDLLKKGEFDEICRKVKYIIHFAAMNSEECAARPAKAVLVNALGTLKLLEAARRQKVKKFIYLSTGHVYGSPLAGKITEDMPARPAHPYSITHRAAEDFVISGNVTGVMAGVVIRLSNAVGAPIEAGVNCWSLVANDLCRQAVTTHKLVLKTAGLQSRDFISIEDVYRALAHMISLPDDAVRGQIFNLGSGRSMRVIDLAKLIKDRCIKVLGLETSIVRPDLRAGERPMRLDYRIDKIVSSGFKPIDGLIEEIDGTLIFCKRNFSKKGHDRYI